MCSFLPYGVARVIIYVVNPHLPSSAMPTYVILRKKQVVFTRGSYVYIILPKNRLSIGLNLLNQVLIKYCFKLIFTLYRMAEMSDDSDWYCVVEFIFYV